MRKRSAAGITALALSSVTLFASSSIFAADPLPDGSGVSRVLQAENAELGVPHQPTAMINDLTFLRRIYIDLIGRIPTEQEIREFAALPKETRRTEIVDQLLGHERFADTWTVFYADMLRLRSNADGGGAAIALVHRAVEEGMPYDELASRMISASGKAGATPEVGFILGDNADPMALAGATAQVFLGIRVACAQCHDHPFDVWTQRDFYDLAAFFGKTRRVETQFTNTVYTTETNQTTILWPPEGAGDNSERQPLEPKFPFQLTTAGSAATYISRLEKLREEKSTRLAAQQSATAASTVDDLLAAADNKVRSASRGSAIDAEGVVAEAKRDARNLKVNAGMSGTSELRAELARLVTDPKNRFFSRAFVNRVWAQLVGRGFVEPVDDFRADNPPSHPQTLDYLADEFVANGYDLKSLVRMIVTSVPYQRSHAVGVDDLTQTELETAFMATPMRRMISEVLYDSIVTAGHLFDPKHAPGKNLKTVWQQSRIAKAPRDDEPGAKPAAQPTTIAQLAAAPDEAAMRKESKTPKGPSYNLESAIELDFDALLAEKKNGVAMVDRMQVMSKEELEAERMQAQMQQERRNVEFVDRFVRATIDDNPQFGSSFRMASPAAPEHFLRVFGQTDRTQLGDQRDQDPSMRQALMMLNGRLTNEASRVGENEPVYELLVGDKANLRAAIQLAYREILTRHPSDDEYQEASSIVADAESAPDGIADLRWILLNCNEFRFLP